MLAEGRGASSLFRRRSVWLKLLQSIHIKAKSEKHIHNMTTIFYLYDCISFSMSRPPLIQTTISTPHTGCKLISHMKENEGMVAMVLVLCSSNSPGHTYMGPLFEFHRWGSFSTASRRRFRSLRKCPLSSVSFS